MIRTESLVCARERVGRDGQGGREGERKGEGELQEAETEGTGRGCSGVLWATEITTEIRQLVTKIF